jgi:hypothetical protein
MSIIKAAYCQETTDLIMSLVRYESGTRRNHCLHVSMLPQSCELQKVFASAGVKEAPNDDGSCHTFFIGHAIHGHVQSKFKHIFDRYACEVPVKFYNGDICGSCDLVSLWERKLYVWEFKSATIEKVAKRSCVVEHKRQANIYAAYFDKWGVPGHFTRDEFDSIEIRVVLIARQKTDWLAIEDTISSINVEYNRDIALPLLQRGKQLFDLGRQISNRIQGKTIKQILPMIPEEVKDCLSNGGKFFPCAKCSYRHVCHDGSVAELAEEVGGHE